MDPFVDYGFAGGSDHTATGGEVLSHIFGDREVALFNTPEANAPEVGVTLALCEVVSERLDGHIEGIQV